MLALAFDLLSTYKNMDDSKTIQVIAEVVSEQGGAIGALVAVLHGLIETAPDPLKTHEAISRHLEQTYAHQLAASTNEKTTAQFELVREMFLQATQRRLSPAEPNS